MDKKVCEELIFGSEHMSYDYSSKNECICSECAEEVISAEEDGVFFTYCDRCGKQFDPFLEDSEFRSLSELGISLSDLSENLCCECGLEQEFIDYPSDDEIL